MDSAVYSELKRVAKYYMSGERSNHTLSPTALVNEAYLKFHSGSNRCTELEFRSVASRNMRQILVNHALAKKAIKRGGNDDTVMVGEDQLGATDKQYDLVEIDEVLTRLSTIDATKARVVELRYFCGYSNQEIAEDMDISLATVKRKWTSAKAWLYREMSD